MNTVNANKNSGDLELRFRLDKTVKSGNLVAQRICDLNCIWCHHDFLDHTKSNRRAVENQQFISFVRNVISMTSAKHAAIRISGDGEPAMVGQEELVDLVRGLREVDKVEQIKLTTNGIRLEPMVQALKGAGLDGVTVSLNSLDPDIYYFYSRSPDLCRAIASIEACLAAGIRTKVNVIYSRLNAREYTSWISFASKHPDLVIKVFDILQSDELTRRLYIPLERLEKQLEDEALEIIELEDGYFSKEYHLKQGGTIQVKVAQRNNCPIHSCEKRLLCLEGCRSSIRIRADGMMQPCGVRTDNMVDLLAKDLSCEKVISALRSAGKMNKENLK